MKRYHKTFDKDKEVIIMVNKCDKGYLIKFFNKSINLLRETKMNQIFKKLKRLLIRAKEVYKEKGLYYTICTINKVIIEKVKATFEYYYCISKKRTFIFQGKVHRYFYDEYSRTWRNERAVEVPIIWDICEKNKGKRILEVGNVLSHYFPINHDVVDKYEMAEGVINEDIVNFQPSKKYDLIVSISTLEHVGWDENPREPGKILKAIEHLKNLLSSGGKMIVTLPLGYNSELDRFLKEGRLRFDKQYYLKRISKNNIWIETSCDDVRDVKYGEPFPNANGLVIGIIERK